MVTYAPYFLSVLLQEVLERHGGKIEYASFHLSKEIHLINQMFIECSYCQAIRGINTAKYDRHAFFRLIIWGLLLTEHGM